MKNRIKFNSVRCYLSVAALCVAASPIAMAQQPSAPQQRSLTSIRHVVIIVGENRTFDHLFATYQPRPGQTTNNLLSKGIVTAEVAPGPF